MSIFSHTSPTAEQKQSPEQASQRADQVTPQIVMYSTRWCGDCRRAKRVFAAQGVSYTEIDIDRDEDAAERVAQINHGLRSVPTILFPDGSTLVEPSTAALEAKLAEVMGRSR